ncbi:MAG: tRNA preQ1(34) S-adenosylmethionine ribosyltransferase-isomerase QueA [Coriobacteriia bacterium]|nr:tRNA preQ1(34) S-adenosylmethionine ribosyltransferase-isomerase QueA [Coriobacteriia bacterium]MBN2822959.1 tRNA preQ1(34) S-adenosylmethionine ribosyltransferase-isomerase QueA [Coriobacteriia bacterium]
MRTDDFDYDLPSGLIAQQPMEPRDACRLMVVERASGQIDHRGFRDLVDYLRAGDVLVVNETRVLPARLLGAKDETGGAVEVFLLRRRYEDTWECLVKPGRRLKPGARIVFGEGELTALVVDILPESGGRLVQFHVAKGTVMDAVHRLGKMPLPPYITRQLDQPELYQTVYSAEEHSVAAPTAGLHFTAELLEEVQRMGVHLAKVELDVGLDTFRPVSEDDPEDHQMHTEHFRVPSWAAETVNAAKERGDRVIAVGTTTVRALESAFNEQTKMVEATEGQTDLFILPGFSFGAVDAVVTNYHMPRSTLLMMMSAFAGRDLIMRAYDTALAEKYRFLSFGDAMLIL